MMRLCKRRSIRYGVSNYAAVRTQKNPAAERRGLILILYRNNGTGKKCRILSAGADLQDFFGWKLKNPTICGKLGLRHEPNTDKLGGNLFAS